MLWRASCGASAQYHGALLLRGLYYCEDLSLSEIGNPLGITRQAVRALIKHTETLLLNYEEKLGFAERLDKMRGCFENLRETANEADPEIRERLITEIDNGLTLL